MEIIIIGSGGDYKDGSNAASIHTREIANNLSHSNKVQVVYSGTEKIEGHEKNVKILQIPYIQNSAIRLVFCYIILPFFFLFFFYKNKYSLIYNRFGSLSFSACVASIILKKKFFLEVNGIKEEEIKSTEGPSLIRSIRLSLIKLLESFVVKKSKGVISVTEGIKNVLKSRYNLNENKFIVVSNGVNEEIYKFIPNAKEQLDFSNKKKFIGFVGNLVSWQGVDLAIRALPEIKKTHPNVVLLIIGDGLERRALELLSKQLDVESMLNFVGQQPYEKVPIYISACEFCIAPWTQQRNSEIGLSPLKLYTYFAVGKTVITTFIPSVKEEVQYNKIGKVVEEAKCTQFAESIVYLLNNEELSKEMGERARKFILNNKTWKMSSKKIENFLTRQQTL